MPIAHLARLRQGVTELSARVYVCFDLVMFGLAVCTHDDIDLMVLVTVIGHKRVPTRCWGKMVL